MSFLYWTFNPKTKSWHFDIASASIGEWEDDFFVNPIPPPQGSQPQLNADDITTYFEKAFGDVLYLYASWGGTFRRDLSYYVAHGILTFGAVVNYLEGIVAHFPSTPSPELYFNNRSRNITAIYSMEVPSRVDMQIHNIQNARFNLYFSLRLPLKERYQLRAAYLSQHPSDANAITYFIDEIGFSLIGDLSCTPSTTRRPAYLFVPPFPLKYVDGMHCICYPLPEPLFYWASDPEGRHVIPENNWVRYGIPELKVKTWIGSVWTTNEYDLAQQQLVSKKYKLNGKQYALDHGYPELIHGDPHERRAKELSDSDEELSNSEGELEDVEEDKHLYSRTHLTSPSTFSLINAPSDLECTRKEGPSITTRLAKRLGLWDNASADTGPQALEHKGKCRAVSQTDNTDGWDLVESDDL
ncbi:hypothetical protein PQX77_018201 [Marasmius sp. AFHP31]|nr:hypothetical protein PQX77_018201 [Marasmius sp. AFHP31]